MKIPEIGAMEHGAYRDTFTKGHTDVVLTDWREPHKRFFGAAPPRFGGPVLRARRD